MSPTLAILSEDDHCLVINKPAGLSTQAPRGIDALEVQVRAYLQSMVNADMVYWQCDPTGEAPAVYVGLPHRLDRPVSGVIVLAKTKKGARKISKQFERRTVKKLYWAAVEGTVHPEAGTWIDWLRKVPGEAHVEVVEENHPEGQRAVLHYRTLGRTEHGSWLEVELETGRMHQIRVQLATRGYPVLGDAQIWKPDGIRHAIRRCAAAADRTARTAAVVCETGDSRTGDVYGPGWRSVASDRRER